MRRRILWALLSAVFLCCCFPACSEGMTLSLKEGEWTWKEESLATFEGSIQFESAREENLILRLSHETNPQAEDTGETVFYQVNGQKLTLRKQKETYLLNAGDEKEFTFTGCWKTPENTPYKSITLHLQAETESGEKLAETSLTVLRENAGGLKGMSRVGRATVYVGIAAGVVWILAILRILKNRKKKAA